VVVKRIEAEEKTKGGIIIPDTAKEKPQEGEIVAVGHGVGKASRHFGISSSSGRAQRIRTDSSRRANGLARRAPDARRNHGPFVTGGLTMLQPPGRSS
jgi:hypothetical protein